MQKYLIRQEVPQVPPYDAALMAQGLAAQLAHFLFPLLVELDALLDKRLVRTFLQTIQVMITFRERANGLFSVSWAGTCSPRSTPQQAPNGEASCCIQPSGQRLSSHAFCGSAPAGN